MDVNGRACSAAPEFRLGVGWRRVTGSHHDRWVVTAAREQKAGISATRAIERDGGLENLLIKAVDEGKNPKLVKYVV